MSWSMTFGERHLMIVRSNPCEESSSAGPLLSLPASRISFTTHLICFFGFIVI